MTQVSARVRLIVLVGALVVLLTVFGGTAVGAADPNTGGYVGRLGGDLTRGISPPSGSGGAGAVSLTGSATRLSGTGIDRGVSASSGSVTTIGSNAVSGPYSTGVSGVNGSGGAGAVSNFRNGR